MDVPVEEAGEVLAADDPKAVESTLDLEALMSQISPKVSQVIRYVKLEGLSVNEAAARTGMSPSAVKVSVHRGLKALSRLVNKRSES
jgi:RNA polymerase sigma-70 factor (ECF subfamily)